MADYERTGLDWLGWLWFLYGLAALVAYHYKVNFYRQSVMLDEIPRSGGKSLMNWNIIITSLSD